MSFDLAVLAMDELADAPAAGAMFERCNASGGHAEAEPDDRIVGFYEQLRSRFPDCGSSAGDSPWMSMPLAVGVDHMIMHLSWGPRSNAAVTAIMELAAQYRLVIWDPQYQDAYLPGA
ncbi:MAG TPA: hypothetical protein VNF47_07690 [Streptosporangiaceae bacterium]|nr:hypothetical protein [Streptosporangiaceae bacterium]